MQALALLCLAFGLVSCQQYNTGNQYADKGRNPGAGSRQRFNDPYAPMNPLNPQHQRMGNQGNQGTGHNYGDQGRAPGAGSRQRFNDPYGTGYGANQFHPQRQQNGNGQTYGDKGRIPGAGSRQKFNDPYAPMNPLGGHQQAGLGQGNAGVNHQNIGGAPLAGQSSRGQAVDYAPVVNPGPVRGSVNHIGAGAQPLPGQGGSSNGLRDIPLGPVMTGQNANTNMNNQGAGPGRDEFGNVPSSGEYVHDYGVGAAAAGNGAAVNGQTGNAQPIAPYNGEAVLGAGNGGGGNSGNGNAPYYGNSPLGGAEISDFTQQEAGKASHSSGGAAVGATAVGVVVAVLVLVGIVGVAAVFLIRQRRSRMTMQQV